MPKKTTTKPNVKCVATRRLPTNAIGTLDNERQENPLLLKRKCEELAQELADVKKANEALKSLRPHREGDSDVACQYVTSIFSASPQNVNVFMCPGCVVDHNGRVGQNQATRSSGDRQRETTAAAAKKMTERFPLLGEALECRFVDKMENQTLRNLVRGAYWTLCDNGNMSTAELERTLDLAPGHNNLRLALRECSLFQCHKISNKPCWSINERTFHSVQQCGNEAGTQIKTTEFEKLASI